MITATRHNQREVRFHNASQHARWDNGRLPRFARHRATGLRAEPRSASQAEPLIAIARLIATAALIGACVAPWLYMLAVL